MTSESWEQLRQRQRGAVAVAKFRTAIREERWTQIELMRESGMTHRAIAKLFGITPPRVAQP